MASLRLLFLTTILVLAACVNASGTSAVSERLVIDGESLPRELYDAVTTYYAAERKNKWEITYQCRSSDFRRLVPFDVYKAEMSKGMKGWNLARLEVIGVRTNETETDERVLAIRFHEQIDGEVAEHRYSNRMPSGTMITHVEETVWVRQGRDWKCIQPGSRGHLPLNDRLLK